MSIHAGYLVKKRDNGTWSEKDEGKTGRQKKIKDSPSVRRGCSVDQRPSEASRSSASLWVDAPASSPAAGAEPAPESAGAPSGLPPFE